MGLRPTWGHRLCLRRAGSAKTALQERARHTTPSGFVTQGRDFMTDLSIRLRKPQLHCPPGVLYPACSQEGKMLGNLRLHSSSVSSCLGKSSLFQLFSSVPFRVAWGHWGCAGKFFFFQPPFLCHQKNLPNGHLLRLVLNNKTKTLHWQLPFVFFSTEVFFFFFPPQHSTLEKGVLYNVA